MSETDEKTVEELKKKAEKPSKDAMVLHPFYKGKIMSIGKCPVRSFDDFAIWYTPGVAAACRAIEKEPEQGNRKENRDTKGDGHGQIEGHPSQEKDFRAVAGGDGFVVGTENEAGNFSEYHTDTHRHQYLVLRKNGVYFHKRIEQRLLDDDSQEEQSGHRHEQ